MPFGAAWAKLLAATVAAVAVFIAGAVGRVAGIVSALRIGTKLGALALAAFVTVWHNTDFVDAHILSGAVHVHLTGAIADALTVVTGLSLRTLDWSAWVIHTFIDLTNSTGFALFKTLFAQARNALSIHALFGVFALHVGAWVVFAFSVEASLARLAADTGAGLNADACTAKLTVGAGFVLAWVGATGAIGADLIGGAVAVGHAIPLDAFALHAEIGTGAILIEFASGRHALTVDADLSLSGAFDILTGVVHAGVFGFATDATVSAYVGRCAVIFLAVPFHTDGARCA